jgi:hypothetical protein
VSTLLNLLFSVYVIICCCRLCNDDSLFWMSLASALLMNRCSSSGGAYDLCRSSFLDMYIPSI